MVFDGYNGGTDGVNFAAEGREQVAGADAQVAYGHVDRVVSSTTVETHEKYTMARNEQLRTIQETVWHAS
jgi:hypothetical protein